MHAFPSSLKRFVLCFAAALALWPHAAFAQGALSNGGDHDGSILVAGEIDTWTFEANLGDFVALSVAEMPQGTNTAFQPYLEVHRPDGTLIGARTGGLAAFFYLQAPVSGTYIVYIRDSPINRPGTALGAYRLRRMRAPAPAGDPLIVPPGDQGGPMINGGNQPGSITLGDFDIWTVNAAKGDYLFVTIGEVLTSQVDPAFNPIVSIYSPNGTELTAGNGGLAAFVDVVAPLTGQYVVLVSDSAVNREPNHSGDYMLHFIKAPATDLVVPAGDEGGPLTNGGNHYGRIGAAGNLPITNDRADVDVWTLTATKNDYIFLSLGEVLTSEVDPQFLPAISVFGPDGTYLVGKVGALAAAVDLRAPLTGLYTVVVGDSWQNREANHTGSYVLHLIKTGSDLIVPVGDEGGPLSNGGNHYGRIGAVLGKNIQDDRGDYDAWTLNATKGDYIFLSVGEVLTSEIDPGFNPLLAIYGPDGALLTWGTGALSVHIADIAPLTGKYTVLVGDSTVNRENNHNGEYVLHLVRSPSSDLITPAHDEGGPLTNGATHTGRIGAIDTQPIAQDPGDIDAWTFTADKGDYITLTLGEVLKTETDPLFNPLIDLFGPDGALVTWSTGALTATIDVVAPLSGVYTALVSDSYVNREANHKGDYKIRLLKTPGVQTADEDGGKLVHAVPHTADIGPGPALPNKHDPSDLDPYTFVANKGNVLTVSVAEVKTSETDPGFIPMVVLLGPDGKLLDWAAHTTLAQAGITAPSTGLYTAVVRDSYVNREGNATGRYQITLTCPLCPGDLSPNVTVTASAGANGTIAPLGARQVTRNSTTTFTVTPNAGYKIASVDGTCGGTLVGQTFTTAALTADCTVTASFSLLPLPTMTLDKTAMAFTAVTSGATWVFKSDTQTLRLGQSGAGTVTWTATPSQPWLQVTPANGTGPSDFSVSVVPGAGVPANGTVTASITFTFTGAGNNPGPVTVTLRTKPNGSTDNPFGSIDTPTDNRTGVTGAIPFTGWILDDVDVVRVMICRAAFGGETAPVDPNCGGLSGIFVGFGLFIEGARPDVAAAFPTYPVNTKAGWGFMVLTNMLPNQGNGTYTFQIYGQDREGHTLTLGTRRMTCSNASATLPFGAIDTPTQGGVTSGNSFVNFGWALTQNPKNIPVDGSTITVLVDGLSVGKADYNHFRPDIATLFPGLANSDGAIGFKILDTTSLANGLHTISWTVQDSGGAVEGIGSRFFAVANGSGALTAAVEASGASHAVVASGGPLRADAVVAAAALDRDPVIARRGWDLDAPPRLHNIGSGGLVVVRGEEVDRFELDLGRHAGEHYVGYLKVGDTLSPLPIGSHLDDAGMFTWAPGVGFIGTYDLVFVRSSEGRAIARRDVRIILAPKGRGHVGTQVEIDTPRSQQEVQQPFLVAGWAADLDAVDGSGVDTVHVWAFPVGGGTPVFLGAADYGGIRPDVASVHGDRFREAGFGVTVQGLPAGTYDLQVFPWSNVSGGFAAPSVVRVTVR